MSKEVRIPNYAIGAFVDSIFQPGKFIATEEGLFRIEGLTRTHLVIHELSQEEVDQVKKPCPNCVQFLGKCYEQPL